MTEHGAAEAELLSTRGGRAGVLTCNEAMLPEVAGRRVAAGAEILVSPSNDSWIRADKWAEQMFDMVALRAIERRRCLHPRSPGRLVPGRQPRARRTAYPTYWYNPERRSRSCTSRALGGRYDRPHSQQASLALAGCPRRESVDD